ncbi:hypothetical protein AVEN_249948-1 [Araneus ventricosus]|uniref:Uncharacterized protein n=1 Tax=Araneus ventricosus TaxID=182803 RepID=A0A4Y2VI04_ARAVE|nr:hypothetical protein AVEN_249948-1 [Araneus ventricosus]
MQFKLGIQFIRIQLGISTKIDAPSVLGRHKTLPAVILIPIISPNICLGICRDRKLKSPINRGEEAQQRGKDDANERDARRHRPTLSVRPPPLHSTQ